MRTSLLCAAAAVSFLASETHAQAGAMQVAPSGRGTTAVTLTLTDTAAARAAGKPSVIQIDYGQPHLRGRTLHTGDLVPYDRAWRLGANDATTLTTDVDLVIGGQPVPKGTYVLQAMPARTGWTLFVQKSTPGMAAAMAYKPENDVARVPLRVSNISSPVESLSMWLIPSGNGAPRGELRITWGTTQLSADWAMR